MDKAILKVINPAYWEDSSVIVGNRAGLEQLKKVIEDALEDNSTPFNTYFYETDGSGYYLFCRMHDDQLSCELANLPTSYDSSDLESSKDLEVLNKFLTEERIEKV